MKNKTQGNGLILFIIIVGLLIVAYFIFKNKTVEAPTETPEITQEVEKTITPKAPTQNETLVNSTSSSETNVDDIENDLMEFEKEIEDLQFEDLGFE